MPILGREPDLYPANLLDLPQIGEETARSWWVAHTLPRREKTLVRQLQKQAIWHYLPQSEHRFRSPSGRNRISYAPVFPGYVFLYGGDQERSQTTETGSVARILQVPDGAKLTTDLRQIKKILDSGCALNAESQLEPGVAVRVTSGPFQGFEGQLLKHHSGDRLLVLVNYLQQGISIALDNWQVERI